jgi:hypothetical protein
LRARAASAPMPRTATMIHSVSWKSASRGTSGSPGDLTVPRGQAAVRSGQRSPWIVTGATALTSPTRRRGPAPRWRSPACGDDPLTRNPTPGFVERCRSLRVGAMRRCRVGGVQSLSTSWSWGP